MAERTEQNIVCVTGLPGSGKSTLCQKLCEDEGFVHVDRDAVVEEVIDQYFTNEQSTVLRQLIQFSLGFPNLVDQKELQDRTRSYVASLRVCVEEAILYIESWAGNRRNAFLQALVEKLKSIRHVDDQSYLELILSPPLFDYVVDFLSEKRSREKALQQERAVLDHPGGTSRIHRDWMWAEFLSRGVDPALVIVQATRAMLMEAAEDRSERKGRVRKPDLDMIDTLIRESEPYKPDENWKRVYVAKRVPGQNIDVDSVRRRIGNMLPTEVFGEIGFLIGS